MEVKNQPGSIKQWYRRAIALDKNWRESKQEKKRLKGRKEQRGEALKQEQRQILPWPLVWRKRQIPPQQVTTGPALIEGVERTNVVMVRRQEQRVGAAPRRDPYAMKVNRGRNCCTCREFRHMAWHCRNQGRGRVADRRRLEYGGKSSREITNIWTI